MLSTVNNAMWQTQSMLHKSPQVVPGTLLSIAGCLVIYRHMNSGDIYGHDHLKTFLAMIVVQMLPLVALEMKIMSCADPVGLFCKFASPVTLVHATFLIMRLCMHHVYETSYIVFSALGLVGALLTLSKGLDETPLSVIRYGRVWGLVCLAILAAFVTNSLGEYLNGWNDYQRPSPSWNDYLEEALSTSNSYIELMAFVPAVWMVYCGGGLSYDDTDSAATKKKATAFFVFIVGFYMTEDLLQAYDAMKYTPIASVAHVAHFLLLLDFACYILAHIYNPEQLVGQLRKWLPKDELLGCSV